MDVIFKAEALSKWFGEVVAVNDLSIELGPGITGLLGPNGAGKSTLIRLITGLYRPSRGSIRVFGETPRNNLNVLARIGYCPEGDHFDEEMTGLEFVVWMTRMGGVVARAARARAIEACEEVAMTGRMNDPLSTYSKGMRQRIKIAQTLALRPELLVLDEPMQGLDPEGREQIFRLIRRMGDEGRSVIVSSHILYEIERVTDTILLLHNGHLLAYGPLRHVRDLIDKHPHTVTIEGPDARRLANRFVNDAAVASMEFNGDSLILRTTDPNRFYADVNLAILEDSLRVHSIHCSDDNLQAVFDYLVH